MAFTSLLSYAQDTTVVVDSGAVDINAVLDHAFDDLDFTEATTGFLFDRGFCYFDESLYPGDTLDTTNFGNKELLITMYASMLNWQLSDQGMATLPNYKSIFENSNGHDTLAVSVIHGQFNRFKPYIIDSNLIAVSNNQYHDVESRTESPYLAKHLVAATTKVQEHNGLNCTFYFPNSQKYIDNGMFEENTVGTSGFVSGTGVFFRWSMRFDYKSVKVIDTLPYQYQNKLLPNCVHTKIGDDEIWITRDIGIVKYKWLNGHVWELVNHKNK
jgi:hypothetical protein